MQRRGWGRSRRATISASWAPVLLGSPLPWNLRRPVYACACWRRAERSTSRKPSASSRARSSGRNIPCCGTAASASSAARPPCGRAGAVHWKPSTSSPGPSALTSFVPTMLGPMRSAGSPPVTTTLSAGLLSLDRTGYCPGIPPSAARSFTSRSRTSASAIVSGSGGRRTSTWCYTRRSHGPGWRDHPRRSVRARRWRCRKPPAPAALRR